MSRIVVLLVALTATAGSAVVQDPVKVDPKHYSVVLENAQVRVLRGVQQKEQVGRALLDFLRDRT